MTQDYPGKIGSLARSSVVATFLVALSVGGCDGRRFDLALAGVSPFASPVADERVDQTLNRSPLEVSLELEAAFADVDRAGVLTFADGMADDLGFWMLAHTGTANVTDAELALWSGDGPDAFAVRWARWLRDHDVWARNSQRLSAGVPTGHVYAHPDELALLFAHVAWRLDLRAELIRSPVHHYVLWREPSGDRARGIEPTCFRRVDALGKVVESEEPSVGRRLVFPEDHYPSGRGGIRNPEPPPVGLYQALDEATLASDLVVRLADRHEVDPGALQARLGEGPAVAQALRRDHDAELSPVPDELVLAAAESGDASGLGPVFAHYEPDGPVELVRSDAHAAAMWVDLRSRRPSEVDWNTRIIPLMNRHRDDPERFAELCRLGDVALRDVEETLDELMPACSLRGAAR